MKCMMEQSLWLRDIKTDNADIPECEICYIDAIKEMSHINDEYNLFDYAYGVNRYILLSELFQMSDEVDWMQLLLRIKRYDSITIVNDFVLQNEELHFAVEFYIKVFFWQLRRNCQKCYVYEKFAEELSA